MIENKSLLMNTYSQNPSVFVKGEDIYLIDHNGKKYLDFVAGIAVNALGYSNETLKSALKEQVDQLLHCSNLYYNDAQLEAVKKLVEKTGMDKAFFCNSGAEAVEGALKLARKYAKFKGNAEKSNIIAMTNSFHGRTFGAISATGQTKYQQGLDPLLPGITHVPYNDLLAIEQAVTDNTCAILLEVIQGEGGIEMVDPQYFKKVKDICVEKDILLILDEVQTGIGRTGYACGYMMFGIKPDIIALAKGLGSGVPVGAIVATDEAAKGFVPGDHASTFGGNPLAMTAVSVVMDEVLNEEMLDHVKEMGAYLNSKLLELKETFPCIKAVKGTGLIQGIALTYSPRELVTKAFEKGLLLVGAGNDVVRFVPPLVVQKHHIDECIQILKEVL